MQNRLTTITEDLLRDQQPSELLSWLWDVQNNLTLSGYLGDLTPAGREDFIGKVSALREFFGQLDKVSARP